MKYIKLIIPIVFFISFLNEANGQNEAQKEHNDIGWHHLDISKDSVPGISSHRAYNELLKNKNSTEIVVAIIDIGVDIFHKDLSGKIWVNEDEIPNNNIDDDHNGYIDDVNGWNFLGNAKGENIQFDTWEMARDFKSLQMRFKGVDTLNLAEKYKDDYVHYKELGSHIEAERNKIEKKLASWKGFYASFLSNWNKISKFSGVEELNLKVIQKLALKPEDSLLRKSQDFLLQSLGAGYDEVKITSIIQNMENTLSYGLNPDYNPRDIIGDDPIDFMDRFYGNADVKGPDSHHGTEIAGVIAGCRNNGDNVNGIAENVKIMPIRALASGDERDKDVVNGIYYAVNNGANIINISFGKPYNKNEKYVDEAIRYAETNNVLIIRAATNLAQNSDSLPMHPDQFYADNTKCKTMINVGASTYWNNERLIWNQSNYGKKSVDVFAPGVEIYTLFPDNHYISTQGTSIAAPVVSGVAALVWSYFPELTALEVRDILMESAEDFGNREVLLPGSSNKKVLFKDLSKTGGVVNAYNAILFAKRRVSEIDNMRKNENKQ